MKIVDWKFQSNSEYEIVTEDPEILTDGLMTTQSASIYVSRYVSPNIAQLINQYVNAGYIKVKVHKLKKRRDWIKP